MKKLWLFAPLLLCIPAAYGQSAVDLNLGFGSAWNSANGGGIDNLNSLNNPLGSCTPGGTDTNCQKTPGLSGFFLGFGGDIMFKEKLGVGVEYSVQPTRQDYGPLLSRQSFIDVNGIYEPISTKRFTVQLQGGIGDSRTSFAISQTGCVGTNVVCSTQTSAIGNANHFQVHLGAGLQVAITEHVFVRPEFDYHYVTSMTDQYGRNSVPAFMVWVGYHWGGSH